MFTRITNSPQETAELAERLAEKLPAGAVLCFEGDLGAGKTLFVQSLAKALGVKGEVTSPTFNLMNVYEDGSLPIVHFDLYRLEREDELDEIGFYEYSYAPDGLVLIEWADKFPDNLPDDYIKITIERGEKDNIRQLRFSARGEADVLLKELEESC